MLDNLQSSLTSDGGDGDGDGGDGGGDGGGSGGGDDEGGTGIGAGISVNIIVAEDTKAAVEDNASLSSGGAIEVSASAESEIETNAFAGAKPDGGWRGSKNLFGCRCCGWCAAERCGCLCRVRYRLERNR